VDDGVRFHQAKAPEKADIEDVARRVHDRVVRWLRRHGYLDERPAEERSNERAALSPMQDMTRIALSRGTFLARPFARKEPVRNYFPIKRGFMPLRLTDALQRPVHVRRALVLVPPRRELGIHDLVVCLVLRLLRGRLAGKG
jgi:hypothetical protein